MATHVDHLPRFFISRKVKNKQATSFNQTTEYVFKNICPTKLLTLTLDNRK